jgi:23S rRNA (pseudouridine1915-N3)-methyltransferase
MRLIVASVGRIKAGPERALLDLYQKRLEALGARLALSPVDWREAATSRAADAAARRAEEAATLKRLVRAAASTIVLDAQGTMLSSAAFAAHLARLRDRGIKAAALLIGGPDGLAPELKREAQLAFSLGAITLPHGLVRIIVAEQLYRAATILAGHPYHRD